MPKELKETQGGGLKEFSVAEVRCFENSEAEGTFFSTQERQWLVLRILESIRAKKSDLVNVRGANLLEGQPIVPKCLSSGDITQIFPLHEAAALEKLQRNWVRDIFAKQPLGWYLARVKTTQAF